MDAKWNTHKEKITYIELIFSTSLWGGVFVFGAYAVKSLDPFYLAAIRYLLASAVLLFIMLIAKKSVPIRVKDLPLLILLGMTGIWAYNILFFLGLKYSTASLGSLLISTSPLWTLIFSVLILKEKLEIHKIIGIIITCAGVAIVLNPQSSGHSGKMMMIGNLFFIAASVCWGLYTVLGRFAAKTFNPVASTTYATFIGTLLLIPFAFHTSVMEQWQISDPSIWGSILFLSIFGSAVAFIIWNNGIAKIGAAKTAIFLNLVPIWGIMFSFILLHERISWQQLLGSLLAVCGVIVVQSRKRIVLGKKESVQHKI